MAELDLTVLANELTTDPASLGYAPMDDADAATTMNSIEVGTRDRTLIESWEIIGATDPAEWAALQAKERERYQTITGAGWVNVSQANVRAVFAAMFAAGTITRAALLALVTRPAVRSVELFGVTVTPSQVADARRI